MRQQALLDLLLQLDAAATVALMEELSRCCRDRGELEVAMLTLSAVLDGDGLAYERKAALYEAAKESGREVVARMLLSGGRQPGSSRPQLGDPVVEPSQPLGYRKAQARGARREVLDRLLHDPDASVLEILLQNPRVIERDAVRLASRRPTTAAAQRAVFRSRHGPRYRVRLAVVLNPYTPVDLTARLLPGLLLSDIREVARCVELAESLREEALALLQSRQPRPFGPEPLPEPPLSRPKNRAGPPS